MTKAVLYNKIVPKKRVLLWRFDGGLLALETRLNYRKKEYLPFRCCVLFSFFFYAFFFLLADTHLEG